MLEPARLDLTIRRGVTYARRLVWSSAGTPVDLAGYHAHLQAREDAGAEVLLDLSDTNGGIVLGAAPGAIDLAISADATALLSFDAAAYDLIITRPDTTRDPLIYGRVHVARLVTQT